MSGRIRLGTQAWGFDVWTGPFYPPGTRAADQLPTYARAFGTVEIDSTVYGTPPLSTVQGWASRVPEDFVFAVKLPREITHERALRHSDDLLQAFLERLGTLGPRLGPVLIQLPAEFAPSQLPAVAQFLPRLPTDIRFAIEFRNKGWIHDGMLALLAEHHVALVLTDGMWIPRRQMIALADRPTADFLYIRLMGPDRTLVDFSRVQIDRSSELERWGTAMRAAAERGLDVFGYVGNHFAGHAPASVRDLQRVIGQPVVEPEQMGEQISLF